MKLSAHKGAPPYRPLVEVQRWIAASGLTQAEFTDILGDHPGQISKYLSGKRAVPIETVIKIAHLTGIPPERIANDKKTLRLLRLLAKCSMIGENT